MKSRLWALLAIALLIAVAALIWRDARQQDLDRVELQAALDELSLRLDRVERQQAGLARELESLRASSVKGMVDQANSAILDGWQALVDTIERQLRDARRQQRDARADEAESGASGEPPAIGVQ